MLPGECFNHTTSALGRVQDFFSGAFGLLILGVVGVAGLFAVYVVLRDSGRIRATMTASAAVAIGTLLTFATGRISTTMDCNVLENRWGPNPQERWGTPAYFAITDTEQNLSTHLRLQWVADGVFFSGVVGFLISAVALRRGRHSLAERTSTPQATATFGPRSRLPRPPAST